MKRKRIVWVLLAALPLILFWVAREQASWRPQMVSLHSLGTLGDFRGSSNRFAFFALPSYVPGPDELNNTTFCRLPNLQNSHGLWPIKKYSTKFWLEDVRFLTDNKAVIWESSWQKDGENMVLHGEILDFGSMKPVRTLETLIGGTAPFEDVYSYHLEYGRGFIRGNSLLYVTGLRAFAWSLETGRLSRIWKLEKPLDIGRTIKISYDASRDRFVQATQEDIRLWDAKTGRLIATKPVKHNDPKYVLAMKFSPHTHFLLQLLADDRETPWYYAIVDCSSAQVLWRVTDEQKDSYLKEVMFDTTNRELWVWHPSEQNFIVHEALTGAILRRLHGPPSCFNFWFTPDNYWLFTRDLNGNIWRQRAH